MAISRNLFAKGFSKPASKTVRASGCRDGLFCASVHFPLWWSVGDQGEIFDHFDAAVKKYTKDVENAHMLLFLQVMMYLMTHKKGHKVNKQLRGKTPSHRDLAAASGDVSDQARARRRRSTIRAARACACADEGAFIDAIPPKFPDAFSGGIFNGEKGTGTRKLELNKGRPEPGNNGYGSGLATWGTYSCKPAW